MKSDDAELFGTAEAVRDALNRGIAEALARHKALGESVFEWRDGRVVEIPASEIRVDTKALTKRRSA